MQASARLPTAWAASWKGRPCASYSRRATGWPGREPAPMPNSSRPPETTSTVAAILASIAGGRKRLLVTSSPRRSRPVCAREGGEQCPALENRPVGVAADRHEVIEQPGMLDLRDGVRLLPYPQHVAVGDLRRSRHDPEPRSSVTVPDDHRRAGHESPR